jgi:maleylacetoacetate isomerase
MAETSWGAILIPAFPAVNAGELMKLYSYFRSSASYRVRIALNLKGISYEQAPVHLVKGEQRGPAYLERNPQGLVPALEVATGEVLVQSLAIIEYLEETHPDPALLPSDPIGRAKVRAIALAIACDIHPLNNTRVLGYLKRELGHDQETVDRWYRHWIATTFAGIEPTIGNDGHCYGNSVTLADVCLVPQVFNARRFDTDLGPFPRIRKVEEVCGAIPAFAAAHPSRQPDAE